MFVIRKDIFLITLILDVCKWYDKYYTGNLHTMKTVHVQKLLAYYNPVRFEECDNLHDERIKFLGEIQVIMNHSVNMGGQNLWVI
jgi:hypothetical protein